MNWRPVLFILPVRISASRPIIDELTIFALTIEFLRTQKFSTSGSYFLCKIPQVSFHLWQDAATFLVMGSRGILRFVRYSGKGFEILQASSIM